MRNSVGIEKPWRITSEFGEQLMNNVSLGVSMSNGIVRKQIVTINVFSGQTSGKATYRQRIRNIVGIC